ncbi:hypothetical protein HDV06_006239 [Boothiomyces sp. JEL0866]|nr:hypothetical protein HDV06_006239 [Boothiomyces sp. JEL0866]
MALPFLPIGSHAIILDYYGSENDELGYYHQSVSMESSFWNLWPHFHKQYYQVLTIQRPQTKTESHAEDEVKNVPISPIRVAMVTYFARQKNTSFHIWGDNEQYRQICHFTLQNIAAYTTHLSMPFFFENANMVDTVSSSAYWGKMAVIEKYMVAGYEWVIWTDIDVIFLTKESLVTKWLDPAQADGKHVALLSECIDDSPANFGAVRSGFLAFRSTPQGFKFLQDWKTFSDHHQLEQSALEEMVTLEPWKSLIYIAPPDGLHTYPKCTHYDQTPISIHFAGYSNKVPVVEEYYHKSVFSQGDQDLVIEAATTKPT